MYTRQERPLNEAERQQLDVEWDSTGRLLPIFYDLYEESILRWNRHPLTQWRARRRDPMSKFRAVMDKARHLTTIWVARHTGEPAAAMITVTFGRTMNYWRGAMNESLAGPSRANYLLHRLAIEKACLGGCTTYHMGETGSSASLSQFKTRFGARPMPYQELRIERIPFTRAWDRAGSLIESGRRAFHVRGRTAGS